MSSFRQPVTARNVNAGSYTNGVYSEGSFTATYEISASIQPSKPEDLENLPKGRRWSKVYRLYTDDTLIPVSASNNGSQVLLFGDWYEVHGWGKWINNVINHNKYLVTKMDEDLI